LGDLKGQFGKRLKTLRKLNRMTQEQLAEASDISVDFLSLIERGKNAPSFEIIERLASSLGVPVKELFDFDR
jgi:transcriptional regulator with XRE-family HTH domain